MPAELGNPDSAIILLAPAAGKFCISVSVFIKLGIYSPVLTLEFMYRNVDEPTNVLVPAEISWFFNVEKKSIPDDLIPNLPTEFNIVPSLPDPTLIPLLNKVGYWNK